MSASFSRISEVLKIAISLRKSINNVSEIKPAAKSYTSTEGKEGETNCAIDSEESDIELDNGGDVAIITKKKESLKEETPPPVQTRYSPEADNPSPKSPINIIYLLLDCLQPRNIILKLGRTQARIQKDDMREFRLIHLQTRLKTHQEYHSLN